MKESQLYNKLNNPQLTAEESIACVNLFLKTNKNYELVPYGLYSANATIAGGASCPKRAIGECLTNSEDAIIERETELHPEWANVESPKQFVNEKMGKNVETMSRGEITEFARDNILLEVDEVEKKYHNVSVIDTGIGVSLEDMVSTILSVHGNNKKGESRLHGHFGQGATASLVFTSGVKFIATRRQGSDVIGFTAVFLTEDYDNLKEPVYKMIVHKETGLPISLDATKLRSPIKHGTKITMFGYEKEAFSNNIIDGGPYFLVRSLLPDAEFPIGLNDRRKSQSKNKQSTKRSFGAFKALRNKWREGASKAQRDSVLYISDPIKIEIDDGFITVQAFVVNKTKRKNKGLVSPLPGFLPAGSAIVVTNNGQNQAEFDSRSKILDRYEYLGQQIAVHINGDGLSPKQKNKFFDSNRERGRRIALRTEIRNRVKEWIEDDDQLKWLEAKAKSEARSGVVRSNNSFKELYKDLGYFGPTGKGGKKKGNGTKETRQPQPIIVPDLTHEPTDIHFVPRHLTIPDNRQKMYVHVVTDATNIFNSSINFNIINSVGNITEIRRTTLINGKTTLILDCSDAKEGDYGRIEVVLNAGRGRNNPSDVISFEVVEREIKHRKPRNTQATTGLPEVNPIPVSFDSDDTKIGTLLAASTEKSPSLGNTLTRTVFNSDSIDLFYSTEGEVYNHCLKKVGRRKEKADEFIAEYIEQLSVLVVQRMNNSNTDVQISNDIAESFAMLAYRNVK